jgi:hypothetical protein
VIFKRGTQRLKTPIIMNRNHSFCSNNYLIVESNEMVFSKKYIFSSVNRGAVSLIIRLAKAMSSNILITIDCFKKV